MTVIRRERERERESERGEKREEASGREIFLRDCNDGHANRSSS